MRRVVRWFRNAPEWLINRLALVVLAALAVLIFVQQIRYDAKQREGRAVAIRVLCEDANQQRAAERLILRTAEIKIPEGLRTRDCQQLVNEAEADR